MLKRILSLGVAVMALALVAPAIVSQTSVGGGVAQAQTPPDTPDAPDTPDTPGTPDTRALPATHRYQLVPRTSKNWWRHEIAVPSLSSEASVQRMFKCIRNSMQCARYCKFILRYIHHC